MNYSDQETPASFCAARRGSYLYASNIAINQGQQQPVHFVLGEDLRLTDVNGVEMIGRIVEIVGRSALVEYRPRPPRPR